MSGDDDNGNGNGDGPTGSSGSNGHSGPTGSNGHSGSSGPTGSNNYFIDPSFASYDVSSNPIVDYTLNQTLHPEPGVVVVNQQGRTIDGLEVTHTTLTTTDPNHDFQINENLVGVDQVYDDEQNAPTNALITQIRSYAQQIQCSDFQGKGTIDDYNGLFQAAAKIANDTKQMELDIDVGGFTEFGKAADDLSALFNSFILKLENVTIIDDTTFLTAICSALQKIVNLSNIFGKFKETILVTSKVELPKSAHDTRVVLEGVMDEINCAMSYISHFVNPGSEVLEEAELSVNDKKVIATAISTIDNWTTLCDEGVSIAMTNNADVQYIHQANASIATTTNALRNATSLLRSKLAVFNITH